MTNRPACPPPSIPQIPPPTPPFLPQFYRFWPLKPSFNLCIRETFLLQFRNPLTAVRGRSFSGRLTVLLLLYGEALWSRKLSQGGSALTRADRAADLIFSSFTAFLEFSSKLLCPFATGSLGANVILCICETDIICDSGDTDEDRDTTENRGWTSHQPSQMKAVKR